MYKLIYIKFNYLNSVYMLNYVKNYLQEKKTFSE